MDLSQIPPHSRDGHVHVVVEIPKGSRNKYEYDRELGVMVLDRALDESVHFPTDYGFVPGSRSADGELLDALVMQRQATFPGCLLQVRLLGFLTITHTDGMPEQKLLGVPAGDEAFAQYDDVSDIPEYLLREIEHFFQVYKDLEGSDIGVEGWEGKRRATQVLEEALREAREKGIPGSTD